jgi:hypothetical protein
MKIPSLINHPRFKKWAEKAPPRVEFATVMTIIIVEALGFTAIVTGIEYSIIKILGIR